jgi:hypothetical protein
MMLDSCQFIIYFTRQHRSDHLDGKHGDFDMKSQFIALLFLMGAGLALAGCTTTSKMELGNAVIYDGVSRHISPGGAPGVSIAAAQACEKMGPEMITARCNDPQIQMFGGPSLLGEVAAPTAAVIAELVHKPDQITVSGGNAEADAIAGAKAEGGDATSYGSPVDITQKISLKQPLPPKKPEHGGDDKDDHGKSHDGDGGDGGYGH